MNIYGIHGTQGVAASRRAEMLKRETGVETKSNVAQRDEMQISAQQAEAAQGANATTFNASEIRLDLVNRIRSEIAAGTYYSDEKFEIALGRMFESFE
jgi:anti-sigma28 factor (negative regulator of flagellin synthesis)